MNKIVIWKMGWLNWLLISIAVLMILITYSEGVSYLIGRWDKQEEYSHGYMLPFVALYFIWLKKNELLQSEFSPSWLGFFIVLPALLVFLIGEVSALYILIHYSLIVVLLGIALSVMGWPAVKPVLPPLLLLVFAIPIPYFLEASLSANLQLLSSRLGVEFIRWCRIPVYLEGNVIDLGGYKLQVVEACSGLRYLFPLMGIGYICAYMFDAAIWKRVLVFLSTIPITLMMNSFRIGVIGILVDSWGTDMAEGFLHDFEGWIIFIACLGLLFIEMFILTKVGKSDQRSLFDVFGLAAHTELMQGDCMTRKVSPPFVAIIVLLIIAVVTVGSIDKREEVIPMRKTFPEFPRSLAGWSGTQEPMKASMVSALGLSDYILSDYKKPGSNAAVNFYVAYYESQRKGISPHSPRVCIPGGGWQISVISRTQVGDTPVNRIVIQKGEAKQLVYYWFQQRGKIFANEYLMKWYLFKDAIFLNRTDGALVRLVTPINSVESVEEADKRLAGFVYELSAMLPEYVPE